ncbi:hypothetical protein BH09ACT8_BH09ACT8_03900 [soil metagenome]
MSWILLLVPCLVTSLWILAYRLKDAGPQPIDSGRQVRHKLGLDCGLGQRDVDRK